MTNELNNQKALGIANILKNINDGSLSWDPTEFANAMFACGFSPDWDLRENELDIIRIGIRENLGCGNATFAREATTLINLCYTYQRYLHG